jgi:hypothetical protein
MNPEEFESDPELLAAAATVLDNLRFTRDMPREVKWRTSEQLAKEMGLSGQDAVDRLDTVLREHEARSLDLLDQGLPPQAVIRRAKYPDRTTALPLWGSVKQHGPPWTGHRPDRGDPRGDVPATLLVPDDAPHVFLSHTHHDADLAGRLAERLAKMGIGTWMFETDIDQGRDIADCVREAVTQAEGLVVLVTRQSIASLWVLTEMHTSLKVGVTIVLVVNADDALLIELLQSVRFPYPDGDFDLSVKYDHGIVDRLKDDYGLRESATRTERYDLQVRDFLATLPSYLGDVPLGTTKRVWRPALAFPHTPAGWSGTVKLSNLQELPRILGENSALSEQLSANS